MYSYNTTCCVECKEIFSVKGIGTHYLRAHTNESTRNTYKGQGKSKFQLYCTCVACKKEMTSANIKRHYQANHMSKSDGYCLQCNVHTKLENKFCSHSCSARYNNFLRNYEKFRSGPKKGTTKLTKISWCQVCGVLIKFKRRKSCSDACLSKLLRESGKRSASYFCKRSKDEIELYELCKSFFNHVEHNTPMFNGWDADIIIHDTKQAILWNGPWHYTEMGFQNHSLSQVVNRDNIKIREIINAGWTPIIFEDRSYTPREAFYKLILSWHLSTYPR